MEEKRKVQRKPYFFMWIVIGIGVGALVGGGLFNSFVVGAGVGVGFGVLLGLWSENIISKSRKNKKDGGNAAQQ